MQHLYLSSVHKALTSVYSHVEDSTTMVNDSVANHLFKCYPSEVWVNRPKAVKTILVQALKGSPDSGFEYKYVVSVDGVYKGQCDKQEDILCLI